MTEAKLKAKIFWWLFVIKITSIIWIIINWQTGGFTFSECFATCTMTLTLLGVYTSISYKYIVKNRFKEVISDSKKLKTGFVWFTRFLLFIYWIAIIVIIGFKTKGDFSFENMQIAFSLAETVIGIYITGIVNELFKKEMKNE